MLAQILVCGLFLKPPQCPLATSRMVVPRRCAPKELNVFDLEGVLERWFTMKNSRDLDAILHSLKQQVSWKTEARASVLAEYSDLFGLLTALTPQRGSAGEEVGSGHLCMPSAEACELFGEGLVYLLGRCERSDQGLHREV